MKNKILHTLVAIIALSAFASLGYAEASSRKQAAPQSQNSEQGYWITTKSGIRHNSKCRYYQNSKGRPCKKDEGRACKICGG